jgi:hypothetical protein
VKSVTVEIMKWEGNFINYTKSVHAIISPTQPNLLRIQRVELLRWFSG